MKSFGLGVVAALLLSCGGSPAREYDNNDLQLITAYTAREMCSCLFVLEQSEEYCRIWTRQNPALYTLKIDREQKVVSSAAVMLWGARARFVDAAVGCVLD